MEKDMELLGEIVALLDQQKRLDKTALSLYINTINADNPKGAVPHMRAPRLELKLTDGSQLLGVNVGLRSDEATVVVSNEHQLLDERYAAKLPAKDLLNIARLYARAELPAADALSKAAIRQLRYDLNLKATMLPDYVQREQDGREVIQRVDFRDMTAVVAVYPTDDASSEDEPERMLIVRLGELTQQERDAVAKLVNAFGGYRSLQTNRQWIDNNEDEM